MCNTTHAHSHNVQSKALRAYSKLTFMGICGTLLSLPTVGYRIEATFHTIGLSNSSNLNVDKSTDSITSMADGR